MKEYDVDFMWSGTYPGSMRFPLFDLITENEAYTKISKEVFLDRIDEAIEAMQGPMCISKQVMRTEFVKTSYTLYRVE